MKTISSTAFDQHIENMLNGLFQVQVNTNHLHHENAGSGLNIQEYKDHFLVEIIAPGYKKEDICISVENDQLIIESKIEAKETNKDFKTIRQDYVPRGFKRTLHVDAQKVQAPSEARYQDGILHLILPKVKPTQPEKRMILVQ